MFKGFDVYKFQSEEPVVSFKHTGETAGTVSGSRIPVLFVHAGHALIGGSVVGDVGLWDLYMGKMHSLTFTS